jgi:hypothetical protein
LKHLSKKMTTFKKTIIFVTVLAAMSWLASMQVDAAPVASLDAVHTEDIGHQDVHTTATDDTTIPSVPEQPRLVPRLIKAGFRY